MKYIATLSGIAFLLHIVWENMQASLYTGYQTFSEHFPICFVGTIGDVVITILVLALVWLFKNDVPRTTSDFLALAILGFVVAVAIEQNALLLGKWNYAADMPIIPALKVGLTPIIQMTLLLPLTFYLTGFLNKKYYEKI